MNPILFESNETNWDTNGLGRLSDATSCVVTEELNGMYELEVVCPYNGNHFKDVQQRRLIYAPVSDASWQIFRIYSISRPIDGLCTINARHISYDLNNYTYLGGETLYNIDPFGAYNYISSLAVPYMPGTWTFYTDVHTLQEELSTSKPRTMRSILGGSEYWNFVDEFGGELQWNNRLIQFLSRRGRDSGVTIRYTKNMSNILVEDESDVYSSIVPYVTKDDSIYTGSIIGNMDLGTRPVDVSDMRDWSTIDPNVVVINACGEKWLDKNQPWNMIRSVQVNLEQYDRNLSSLESISLGDTVKLIHLDYDINQDIRVSKTVWNCLEERYTSIELGTQQRLISQDLAKLIK